MSVRNLPGRVCKLLLAAGALVAMSASSLATGDWIAVGRGQNEAGPQGPQVVVGRADGTGLDATVELSGVALSLQETPGGEFLLVNWPGSALGGQSGAPALPVVRKLFIAPPGATISLGVNESPASMIDLSAAGFDSPVIPWQPQVPVSPEGVARPPFHYDADCYAMDCDSPAARATVTKLGIMRGRHLYLLEVRPVAYNPARGTLTVWPRLDLEIGFEGGAVGGDAGWLPPLNGVLLNPPAPRSHHSAEIAERPHRLRR